MSRLPEAAGTLAGSRPSALFAGSEVQPFGRRQRRVRGPRLPVIAVLEELPMRLRDVAQFRVGGVLPLQSNGFESVRLECAGRGVFLCRLGQGDGKYRLEIDVPIEQEPESAVH